MFKVAVKIINRTEDYEPIVKRLDTGEEFIVNDDNISEQFGTFYVDEYNLIRRYTNAR